MVQSTSGTRLFQHKTALTRQQATFVASKGITLDTNLANTAPEPFSTPSQQPSTIGNQSSNNNSPISAEFKDQITDEKAESHFLILLSNKV